MLIESSTICKPLLDKIDYGFPPDLLLQLARPFKDCHGTHLLGKRFLYLDPCDESPYQSGFVTYEKEIYFQKSRLFLSFEYPRLQIYSYGTSLYETELLKALESTGSDTPSFHFAFSCAKEPFIQGCKRVKELILDGLVYQLNLSHEILFEGNADPFTLFEALLKRADAPFAAYICHKDSYFLSLSPERLLKNRKGFLETRPIKGTIARGEGDIEALTTSAKERSELLMITDLMRNDLYAIAQKGSIEVEELCKAVVYPHLVHMESKITARLRPGLSAEQALMAIFPGGSITGCPKIHAMEYIREIEGRKRGIFTGSIGYITEEGDFDFNIAIRTLVKEGSRWSLRVGAGIVFDSDPEKEYLETLCKAKPFLDVMT